MQANFKKIFSLGAIYGIGSAAEKLQSIIFLPLYTRYLSPADFGVLALLVLIADLIGKVIITPLVAGLGRYYYKPDWVDKKKILVFNLFIFLGIQCAIAAVLYWLLSS